jgi:hypothetical protein
VRYLSAPWFDAARDALAGDAGLPGAVAGISLSIEQVVEGGPGGTVTWHLDLDGGRAALATGPAARPDLRFTTAYDTAARIAAGTLSAQRAFAEGRLRVGGNLSLLIAHQRAFAAVDDVLAGVRAQTTFD